MSQNARLAAVAALVLSASALAAADPAPVKTPTAAEIAAATETLKDVFDKDYAASDAKGKAALARKLFDLAAKRKTPAMVFACYEEARRLAAEAGDVKTALAAAEATNRRFIDVADFTRDTLRELSQADLSAGDAATVVKLAREQAAYWLDREQYGTSVELVGYAASAAKKLGDPDLALDLREYRTKLEDLNKAFQAVRGNPKSEPANSVLGEYWAFERGDWDRGIKYLARGSDKALAAAATEDQANPKAAKERTSLADRWYKLAQAADGNRKRLFAERAWVWYTAAVAVATGDYDLKPSERARQIEKDFPALFNSVFEGHTSAVAAIAITPDGKALVSVGNDNLIRVWDTSTGRQVRTMEGHGGWVGSVVVTPDGSHAVTAGGDNVIRIWDLKTGRSDGTLEGHTVAVRGLAITADGKFLVSGGSDKTCRLWNLTDRRLVRKFGTEGDSIESVAVTSDGARILAGTDNGVVVVFDAKTGETVSKFERHGNTMVYTIAVTRDGKTAISGARDKVIRVWDVNTGKETRSLVGHTEQVYQVVLSADEKHLLSASFDKTVRLWDFATGKESKRFEGHTDGVQGVCYGADGRTVFSAGWDKTVRKWRLPPGLASAPAEKE